MVFAFLISKSYLPIFFWDRCRLERWICCGNIADRHHLFSWQLFSLSGHCRQYMNLQQIVFVKVWMIRDIGGWSAFKKKWKKQHTCPLGLYPNHRTSKWQRQHEFHLLWHSRSSGGTRPTRPGMPIEGRRWLFTNVFVPVYEELESIALVIPCLIVLHVYISFIITVNNT